MQMQKKQVDLIKVGGACLTQKSSFETLNEDAILLLSDILHRCPSQFILVHGAGSFGHQHAKKAALDKGASSENELSSKVLDISATRNAVRRLNARLVQALIQKTIPAIGVSPSDFLHFADQAPLDLESFKSHIQKLLQGGFVPVIHGDVFIDQTKGCGIFGGDDIMLYLSKLFHPQKCIFVSNVPGVLDIDNNVIPMILVTHENISSEQKLSNQPCFDADVTGGMHGKLRAIEKMVRAGVGPVWIVDLAELENAFMGKNAGTIFLLKS